MSNRVEIQFILNSAWEYRNAARFVSGLRNVSESRENVRFWRNALVRNYDNVWEEKIIQQSTSYPDYGYKILITETVPIDSPPSLEEEIYFSRQISRISGERIYQNTTITFRAARVENILPDGQRDLTYEFEAFVSGNKVFDFFPKVAEDGFLAVHASNTLYTFPELQSFRNSMRKLLGETSSYYLPLQRPLTYDDFPGGLIDGEYEYYASERPKGPRKLIGFDDVGMWEWYPPYEYNLVARRSDLGVHATNVFEGISIPVSHRKIDENGQYMDRMYDRPTVIYIYDCLSAYYHLTGIQTFGYEKRIQECRRFVEGFNNIPTVYLSYTTFHRVDRNNFFTVCSGMLDKMGILPYEYKGITFTPNISYNKAKIYTGDERTLATIPDVCIWKEKITFSGTVRTDEQGEIGVWSLEEIRLPGNLNPKDPFFIRSMEEQIVEFEYSPGQGEYLPLKGIKTRLDRSFPSSILHIATSMRQMQDPITTNVMTGIDNFLLMSHYHERIISHLGGVSLEEAEKYPDQSVPVLFVDVMDKSRQVMDVAIRKLVPKEGKITFLSFDIEAIEELLAPKLGGIIHREFTGDGFDVQLDPSGMVIVTTEQGEEVIYEALRLDSFGENIIRYRADTEIGTSFPPLLNNRENLLSRIHVYGEITVPTLKEMSDTFCSFPKTKVGTEFGSDVAMISENSKAPIRVIRNHNDLDNTYVRIRTIGDGNCLFHAVLQAIYPAYNQMSRPDKVDLATKLRLDVATFITEVKDEGEFPLSKWARFREGSLALRFLDQIIRLQSSCYERLKNANEPYDKKKPDDREPIHEEEDAVDNSMLGFEMRLAKNGLSVGDVAIYLLADLLDIDLLLYEIREEGLPPILTTQKLNSDRKCVMIGHVGGNHYETIGMKLASGTIQLVFDGDSKPSEAFTTLNTGYDEEYEPVMEEFLKHGIEAVNVMFSRVENVDDRLSIFKYMRPTFDPSFEHMVTKLFYEYHAIEKYSPRGEIIISKKEWPSKSKNGENTIPTCAKSQLAILEEIDPESEFLLSQESKRRKKAIGAETKKKVGKKVTFPTTDSTKPKVKPPVKPSSKPPVKPSPPPKPSSKPSVKPSPPPKPSSVKPSPTAAPERLIPSRRRKIPQVEPVSSPSSRPKSPSSPRVPSPSSPSRPKSPSSPRVPSPSSPSRPKSPSSPRVPSPSSPSRPKSPSPKVPSPKVPSPVKSKPTKSNSKKSPIYSKEDCEKWIKSPTKNPQTNRPIAVGKDVYNNLQKQCKDYGLTPS